MDGRLGQYRTGHWRQMIYLDINKIARLFKIRPKL